MCAGLFELWLAATGGAALAMCGVNTGAKDWRSAITWGAIAIFMLVASAL